MVNVLSVFVIYPIVVFLVVFLFCKFILHKRKKSIGIASDVSTFFLYFSITNLFFFIFLKEIGWYLVIFSIILATIMTYLEWRTKKEIEVIPLLRKIWRLLFLLLCSLYALLWLFGVIRYVLSYIS
ncbi:DUF3397 family protein [Psychrobacillus sp. INOP01]|uniref:DUF3397 family protein n=1 Tax=Psychrobacillus sp. INOP01 TaxID=2829187 RepID=UPI001BAB1DF6|nr:DUF3397 family protein [Psychrobacillus sp. INOP01]QUG40993.1 DUF3397 family protein [Psychrobacillus sp. INOP01]